MRTRLSYSAAAVVLLLGGASLRANDDVTANEPLTPPLFTIDPNSPEVTGGPLLPGDLLVPADPNLLVVEVPAANLSLYSPADDVDALAFEGWDVSMADTFVVIFSVDRTAIGGVAPDPQLVALGFPFNVKDQATKNQAGGDLYMSLLLFDRFGYIPPAPLPRERSVSANNTLVVNQGDAGGVDTKLSPAGLSPAQPAPPGQQSNLNGGAGTQPPLPPCMLGGGSAGREPPEWLLFSLAAGSPSLPTMPGGNGSAADIYVDTNPSSPGGEGLWVGPMTLGLTLGDDIDALIVFDDGDRVFTSGYDQIVFSLAPGSPSLGSGFQPGDLLMSEGFGIFAPYCPGEELGLAPGDNLNMLDYVLCEQVLACVYYWAIGYVGSCAGDINGDGEVGLDDLAILLASYGHCAGDPEYYPGADLTGDDCVRLADLATLLAVYGTSCRPG